MISPYLRKAIHALILVPLALVALGTILHCQPAPAAGPPGDGAIRESARSLARELAGHGIDTLLVLDLEADEEEDLEIAGRLLSDELTGELLAAGPLLSICDRDAVRDLLQELEFQATGLVQPEEMTAIGRFCGPDAVLRGTVYQRTGDLAVSVKVIDLGTSRTVAGDTFHLPLSWLGDMAADASSTSSGGGSEPVSGDLDAAVEQARRRARSGPFTFEYRDCTFESEFTRCVLSVHNHQSRMHPLAIRADSALFDTANTRYRADFVVLGGDRHTVGGPDDVFERELPPDGHVQLELIFLDVPRRKKKVQTLQIDLGGWEDVHFGNFFFDRIPRD